MRLGVTLQTTDPVIKIVHRDEEDVGTLPADHGKKRENEKQDNRKAHHSGLTALNRKPPGNQTHVSGSLNATLRQETFQKSRQSPFPLAPRRN
jgi:hypothetical protein